MRVWILESEDVVCGVDDSPVVGAYSCREFAVEAADDLELRDYTIVDLLVV
jgi:hypothetical protein